MEKKKKKTLPEDFFVKNEKKYYWLYISVKNGKKITGYIFFPKKKKNISNILGLFPIMEPVQNKCCMNNMMFRKRGLTMK